MLGIGKRGLLLLFGIVRGIGRLVLTFGRKRAVITTDVHEVMEEET